jgi:hypothetical protein
LQEPHKYFFKASDAVLSHCACSNAPAQSEGQLDCPWCGCGWLISCLECGKAFTFAEVRATDVPLIEFGRREIASRRLKDVTEQDLDNWVEWMAETLDRFEVGDIVVYLDGHYWKRDATNVVFGGFYASHSLKRLPHAEALSDPGHLDRVLGDKRYWLQRERPDRE